MKKFEDLSNVEKQKLSIYLQYQNAMQITGTIGMLFCLLLIITGVTFIIIFVLPVLIFAGFLLLGSGYALLILGLLNGIRDKKYLFLIFGYKNLFSDIFDIEKEHIKKVKIKREVKWINENKKEK